MVQMYDCFSNLEGFRVMENSTMNTDEKEILTEKDAVTLSDFGNFNPTFS